MEVTFKILIATEKNLDPREGKGVATWALDLKKGFTQAGYQCGLVGRGHFKDDYIYILPNRDVYTEARFISDIVRSEGYDVVLSASSRSAFCAWPHLPSDCLRIPTVHAALLHTVKREVKAEPMVDAFVGISESVTQVLREVIKGLVPVFAVPNGINFIPEESPLPSSREPLILVVGRLEIDQKRSHWLPRIFHHVLKSIPKARLLIYGNGPERRKLAYFSSLFGTRFEVRDPIPREELFKVFSEARVFLMTSRYEGLSIAMLEAMANSMVVVCPDSISVTGGVLDQSNALLVRCSESLNLTNKDADAFAREISLALKDDRQADLLGTNARETVKNKYTVDSMTKGYLNIFTKISSLGFKSSRVVVPVEEYCAESNLLERLYRKLKSGSQIRFSSAREIAIMTLTSFATRFRFQMF